MRRTRTNLLVLVVLVLASVMAQHALASEPEGQPSAVQAYTMIVKDQFGYARSGAIITARKLEGAGPVAASATTDENGIGYLYLDPTIPKFVVEVVYPEFESTEWWWYGYILTEDWSPSPVKTVHRTDPWIDQVSLPTEPVVPGQPYDIQVVMDHAHPRTNFDLRIRVWMWVDDDGLPPYLHETVSEIQYFYQGIEPFDFVYIPQEPGSYMVRFVIERNWEGTDWYVADDGGWSWTLEATTVEPSTITGAAFVDWNRDEIRQDDEPGVEGLEVALIDDQDETLLTVATDQEGVYLFSEVTPGAYQVGFDTAPNGLLFDGRRYDLVCEPGVAYEEYDFPLWPWRLILPLVHSPS